MNDFLHMRTPKVYARWLTLCASALLICADQWIKRLVLLRLGPPHLKTSVILRGVLRLRYAENTGISFSMFGDSRAAMAVISVLTALVMLAGIAALLFGKIGGTFPLCGAALILAGGIGNLVDRMLHGFVVDYFELLFVRFAIFNFADVCISCGVVMLAGWVAYQEYRRRKAPVNA